MAAKGRKSKRQFSTKRPPVKLPEPVLFLDRSLGSVIVPEALRNAGASIELLKDHFTHDEKDTVWLEECGRKGWVVLTKDRNIRYNLVERQALLDAGVAAFVLTSGQMNGAEMADAFIKALPKIANFLEKYTPPYIARVYKDGKIEMWIDAAGEIVVKS